MDIIDSTLSLIQKNFLNIITILWIIWFAGVALGVIVSTVSKCIQHRILHKLSHISAQARQRQDENAVEFDLEPAQIKHTLMRREAELSEDVERMSLDFGVQGVLENFRDRIQRRLADIPATRQDLLDRFQKIYVALNDFKDLCGANQIFLARMALKRGATGKTVTLLKRVQSLGNQKATEAAGSQLAVARNKKLAAGASFLLGQLAEIDFNYFTATQYYQIAADLQPANLTYLKAAAELSYAFGEFHETGHLLEQVLRIQEKLLGPEHIDLAQTLNNLGVLRHTQDRQAEAEAYYVWALEICEANRHPQDPDAVNLLQNYAVFLQEVGRHPEAEIVKARTAAASPEDHTPICRLENPVLEASGS
jgi:tetratricopeptide (TPR) repeat protein